MRTSCTPAHLHNRTHTRSQTQIWTHVRKSATAGSWACLMCGNQRGPLAHELIFVLVWSFDINAVSSRSSLIFKCCTSQSCSYACTTNSRMLISSEQTLKMQHNNQRFLPPAGEGGKDGRVADASGIRKSQLVVRANRHERPRATAADSPVSAWGVCGLFQSSRNHQRPPAHL